MRSLLAAALVGLTGACTTSSSPGVDSFDLFDTMVDRHIEAGYEDPRLRPDDPLLASRTIVVTASINERTAKDVVSRLLYLNAVDAETPIDLVIATPGGWSDSTFAIVDVIGLVDAPVNVTGVGGVYSGGAMILCAGTGRRAVTDGAIIMVHANESSSSEKAKTLSRERDDRLWRRSTV